MSIWRIVALVVIVAVLIASVSMLRGAYQRHRMTVLLEQIDPGDPEALDRWTGRADAVTRELAARCARSKDAGSSDCRALRNALP